MRFLMLCALLLSVGLARADALVSTEWLAAHLDDPQIRLFEVSVAPEQYDAGHIPGAFNLDWHTDLVDPVRRDIAPREQLQAQLRAAGVDAHSTLVLYGDNHNWFAAWGAWIFETYGLEQVKLLDGGRIKWELEGRVLTREASTAKPSQLILPEASERYRARLGDVVDAAQGRTDVALLDIRSPDEYQGRVIAPAGSLELSMRAGHVPGAVNVPWSKVVQPDGRFRPVEELRALYQRVGIDGQRPVITYCRIGERSSHSWFVLHRLLGYPARNYDGSWTEYGNSVGVPIDNPAGTVWRGR
ncbi:sulfurtransferase [Pseudomonas abyssi]|jgi:thiosulfate/3-mercaptopyruvate sulfurtransferase|uniref:Sulfurtransferase n=1 Tax=Pseudomonas abyssi TaxID=170540 RepID=A0A2A3MKI1_9PSED|nr:sulfurtransferase [Pseudomonas abyssi]MAC98897.1 sulfurtransferase [Pseudomonadales bacterium]PBK05311.1 sulfurtransferase [Pseudomonas abyssi]|tara:strand:- start:29417 stop:30316 length:900 start_codon:yes stop_codon:yes gene_type:complete